MLPRTPAMQTRRGPYVVDPVWRPGKLMSCVELEYARALLSPATTRTETSYSHAMPWLEPTTAVALSEVGRAGHPVPAAPHWIAGSSMPTGASLVVPASGSPPSLPPPQPAAMQPETSTAVQGRSVFIGGSLTWGTAGSTRKKRRSACHGRTRRDLLPCCPHEQKVHETEKVRHGRCRCHARAKATGAPTL